MNQAIPVDKLPFRVMRTIERALMETAASGVTQIEPPPVRLEAEILGGLELVRKRKNATRVIIMGSICAWYELTGVVQSKLPEGELKTATAALLSELSWIQELIDKVQKARNENS